LTAALLQATESLQRYRECLPVDNDADVKVCPDMTPPILSDELARLCFRVATVFLAKACSASKGIVDATKSIAGSRSNHTGHQGVHCTCCTSVLQNTKMPARACFIPRPISSQNADFAPTWRSRQVPSLCHAGSPGLSRPVTWPGEDSSFSWSSDSESDRDFHERLPVNRRVVPAVGVLKMPDTDIPADSLKCPNSEPDFDSDSDVDSGYASVEGSKASILSPHV